MTLHGRRMDKIKTAVLLAAGTGSRLRPLTTEAPKCLTVVGGIPILERLLCNLGEQGFEKLVIVTGHLDVSIRDFLSRNSQGILVEYVFNPVYQTTNNIYSLWLAKEKIREPFLLVESDLVFDSAMLEDMLDPDRIAVSKIRPWMNGTTVSIGPEGRISAFLTGGEMGRTPCFKTVNIYSLSLPTWEKVLKRLDRFISQGKVGEYYEAVFAEMVCEGTLSFEAVFFDPDHWYEIDTMKDLDEAEKIFGTAPPLVLKKPIGVPRGRPFRHPHPVIDQGRGEPTFTHHGRR